jgi:hypothetical protein
MDKDLAIPEMNCGFAISSKLNSTEAESIEKVVAKCFK